MKSSLQEFISGISLQDAVLGAIFGLVVSAALQPFAIGFFTDFWVMAGAPGYNPPSVNAEMSELETGHTPGEELSQYGGITWKKGFEVYRLTIENAGNKPAYDVSSTVPLPGCIVGVSEDNPLSRENYGFKDIISANIGGQHNKSVYSCSKIVGTDRLFPKEKIVLDFVVKDQFKPCQVLSGVHEDPEIIVNYRWRKASNSYPEVNFEMEPELQNEYSKFKSSNEGAYIEALKRHGRVYGVLIPYNTSEVSNPHEVLTRCSLVLPKGS